MIITRKRDLIKEVIEDAISKIDTTKINLEGRDFRVNLKEKGLICISGGLNGRGIWSNYFEILSKLMFQIELRYPDAYVEKLENDSSDDIFYMYIRIPGEEQKEFSDIKIGNKKPGNREIVPEYIVKKVMNGEGVIHKYKGSWRIVSMKTNPPTFWSSKYPTKEAATGGLKSFHSNRH